MTYEDRFWSRVDMSGDCWLWTRGLNGVGYGMYDAPHKVLAHRYAWLGRAWAALGYTSWGAYCAAELDTQPSAT